MKTTLLLTPEKIILPALLNHGSSHSWKFERIICKTYLFEKKYKFFKAFSMNNCNVLRSNCIKILSHEKYLHNFQFAK